MEWVRALESLLAFTAGKCPSLVPQFPPPPQNSAAAIVNFFTDK